jgi:hypothetical protein
LGNRVTARFELTCNEISKFEGIPLFPLLSSFQPGNAASARRLPGLHDASISESGAAAKSMRQEVRQEDGRHGPARHAKAARRDAAGRSA